MSIVLPVWYNFDDFFSSSKKIIFQINYRSDGHGHVVLLSNDSLFSGEELMRKENNKMPVCLCVWFVCECANVCVHVCECVCANVCACECLWMCMTLCVRVFVCVSVFVSDFILFVCFCVCVWKKGYLLFLSIVTWSRNNKI